MAAKMRGAARQTAMLKAITSPGGGRRGSSMRSEADEEFKDFIEQMSTDKRQSLGGSKRKPVSVSAAMVMQAGVRRLLIRIRRARLAQYREVRRRKRVRESELVDDIFTFEMDGYLRAVTGHSEESLNQAVNSMPAVRRNVVMRGLVSNVGKQMHALKCIAQMHDAATETAACDGA